MADHSDKKSIMMYVMCYFQVLSKPHKLADDFTADHRVGNDVRFKGGNVCFFFCSFKKRAYYISKILLHLD